MSKHYNLIEKYGCTFIMMYHAKKDSSAKSIREKVTSSGVLSASVDSIIAIDKDLELDTEFRLKLTSRLLESKNYNVKSNPRKQIVELEKIGPIESLEAYIQRLVQNMTRLKEDQGIIVDISSKINLDRDSLQKFKKS